MRKSTNLGIALLFLLSSSVSLAQDNVDRGRLLYENHCRACHTEAVHERENRKVNSLVEMSKMILRWQYHLHLNWTFEDVSQVMAYLNQTYYKIETRPIEK